MQATVTSTVDTTITNTLTTTTTPTVATTTTTTVTATPKETLLAGYLELTVNGGSATFLYTNLFNDGTYQHVLITIDKSSAYELYLDTTTGYLTGAGHAYTIAADPNAATVQAVYFAPGGQVAAQPGYASLSCQLGSGDALSCSINQQPAIFYFCDGSPQELNAAVGVPATCTADDGTSRGNVVLLTPSFNPS